MQFPIQLVVTCTIHWAQGLTLAHLAIDLNGVYKHGLTYITLSCIKINKIFTYFNLCKWKISKINLKCVIEMHWFQTTAQWDVLIPTPHTFHHSHVLIFSLNTKFLSLHKNDVFFDCNLRNLIYYVSIKHISIHKHQILFLLLI